MYTDRQLKIIAVLKSADGWMSGSLLRENIGVSSRTLQIPSSAWLEMQHYISCRYYWHILLPRNSAVIL